jgi:hypothetical protein
MHHRSCRFYPDIRNNGIPDLSLGGNGPFPGGEKASDVEWPDYTRNDSPILTIRIALAL